ncbi:hypothetical protein HID58_040793, partial [Brassica napus]
TKMDSLTYDLWTMALARLPIKIFTCFKLVCKQWKSIVVSPFFHNLFLSLHQNSACSSSSSWSLMSTDGIDEMADYYHQCDIWGLKRPLSSFIKSVLNDKNPNQKYQKVNVVAYSDVGLILICAISKIKEENSSLYVANPVSHECVEIFLDPLLERSQLCFSQGGIATRIDENGILLGYKVVVFNQSLGDRPVESGRYFLFNYYYSRDSISLNSNLHWLAKNNDYQDVVLSMDLYTNSKGSDRCHVSPFPDLEKTIKFDRACCCTPCHGFLMYMNIVSTTKFDLTSDGRTMIPAHDPRAVISFENTFIGLALSVLPQWMYRIPNTVTVRRV